MDDEIDDGGKNQDDKPYGPWMQLMPVGMMVPRQDGQNQQVQGGHRHLLQESTWLYL